jgi:AcrR family transcriptional regulator
MPRDSGYNSHRHPAEVAEGSDCAHRAILGAALTLLSAEGCADLRPEDVAARAGVGSATISRRWPSEEALALDLLLQLAAPHIAVEETGDART